MAPTLSISDDAAVTPNFHSKSTTSLTLKIAREAAPLNSANAVRHNPDTANATDAFIPSLCKSSCNTSADRFRLSEAERTYRRAERRRRSGFSLTECWEEKAERRRSAVSESPVRKSEAMAKTSGS